MTTDLAELERLITKETRHYSGGPSAFFEEVGRHTLQTLLHNGLLPSHRLLDFGCGSLRNGYWLIRFLDSGNYYGLEPKEIGVHAGLKHLIGPELQAFKQPTFLFNTDSDIAAFGVPFDYIVARSILTHTCTGMLRKMLESFSTSSPDGMLLASYWRHDTLRAFPKWAMKGRFRNLAIEMKNIPEQHIYVNGDHLPDDDMRFVEYVTFSLPRMQEIAADYGLTAEEDWTSTPINKQIWLKFKKKVA